MNLFDFQVVADDNNVHHVELKATDDVSYLVIFHHDDKYVEGVSFTFHTVGKFPLSNTTCETISHHAANWGDKKCAVH